MLVYQYVYQNMHMTLSSIAIAWSNIKDITIMSSNNTNMHMPSSSIAILQSNYRGWSLIIKHIIVTYALGGGLQEDRYGQVYKPWLINIWLANLVSLDLYSSCYSSLIRRGLVRVVRIDLCGVISFDIFFLDIWRALASIFDSTSIFCKMEDLLLSAISQQRWIDRYIHTVESIATLGGVVGRH